MSENTSSSGKIKKQARKTRGIGTTTIVEAAVKAFSRDDDFAWCDPNLNITVYDNGVPLPCRVWVHPTWEMRVSAFNNSSHVKRLRADIKDAKF